MMKKYILFLATFFTLCSCQNKTEENPGKALIVSIQDFVGKTLELKDLGCNVQTVRLHTETSKTFVVWIRSSTYWMERRFRFPNSIKTDFYFARSRPKGTVPWNIYNPWHCVQTKATCICWICPVCLSSHTTKT